MYKKLKLNYIFLGYTPPSTCTSSSSSKNSSNQLHKFSGLQTYLKYKKPNART